MMTYDSCNSLTERRPRLHAHSHLVGGTLCRDVVLCFFLPSPPLHLTYQAQGLSTIDTNLGVYYIIAVNDSTTPASTNLIGISTATGDVISEMPLPFAQQVIVGLGQYVDWQTGTPYVLCTGPDVVCVEITIVNNTNK